MFVQGAQVISSTGMSADEMKQQLERLQRQRRKLDSQQQQQQQQQMITCDDMAELIR